MQFLEDSKNSFWQQSYLALELFAMQDDLEKVKDHTVILHVICWKSEEKAWDHWNQMAFWFQWDSISLLLLSKTTKHILLKKEVNHQCYRLFCFNLKQNTVLMKHESANTCLWVGCWIRSERNLCWEGTFQTTPKSKSMSTSWIYGKRTKEAGESSGAKCKVIQVEEKWKVIQQ